MKDTYRCIYFAQIISTRNINCPHFVVTMELGSGDRETKIKSFFFFKDLIFIW